MKHGIKFIQKHENSDATIVVTTSPDLSLTKLHCVWEQFLTAIGYDEALIKEFYPDENYGVM